MINIQTLESSSITFEDYSCSKHNFQKVVKYIDLNDSYMYFCD